MRKKRVATVNRKTRETDIAATVDLDGTGRTEIETGLPFLNHMLELLGKHALIDLRLKARGDLHVDYHHTVEDIGLVLGTALDQALGDRKGIGRYGSSCIPMDDALARAVVDLGGRPYLVFDMAHRQKKIIDFDLGLIREFFQAFSVQARMNLHICQMYGQDAHHAYEAVFKAVARALRMACTRDPRVKGVPSSKGRI